MNNLALVTRFAPSPTGYLHLGHAYAAQQAFGFAEQHGGVCLLRIEDIDHTRCRGEYLQAILEDLSWLGFDWLKAPPHGPVRIQSAHLSDYDDVIDRLRAKGLLYRCFKTRREIAALSESGVYFGNPDKDEMCKLAENAPFAWRLNLYAALSSLGKDAERLGYEELGPAPGWTTVDPGRHGDVVLARKDIGTSYHIAVTHDDALQMVSHVVRGADLKDQTDIHVLLQALMGWPTPTYLHHPLLLNDAGEKLAKRNKDTAIRELRESGMTPDEILELARA